METILFAFLFGIVVGVFTVYLLSVILDLPEKEKQVNVPNPLTLNNTFEAPPTTAIPYELWPPATGWHNIILLDDTADMNLIKGGFITPTTFKLSKIALPAHKDGNEMKQLLNSLLKKGQLKTAWLYGRDSEGKTLAEFYDEKGDSINKWLVDNNHAVNLKQQ